MNIRIKTKVSIVIVMVTMLAFAMMRGVSARTLPWHYHDGSYSQVYTTIDYIPAGKAVMIQGDANLAWCGANPYYADRMVFDVFLRIQGGGSVNWVLPTGSGFTGSGATAHWTGAKNNCWMVTMPSISLVAYTSQTNATCADSYACQVTIDGHVNVFNY